MTRRFHLDPSVQIHGRVVIGGSPLKLFRLTDAGAAVLHRIASGDSVDDSPLTDALLAAGAIHPDPTSMTSPLTSDDVTIVVPTLGAPGQVPPGAIVVDDGSAPPVPGAAIRLDTNRGPGAARNAGLVRVTTPLVAFVDADVELSDGWLDGLLPHFADGRVGLVAPRVATSAADDPVSRYEQHHGPLDLGTGPARIRAGSRVGYVPAAAIVCRTDAIRDVGGFDESMRFGEDVDLVWRLDAAGWRCRYEPVVVVHHPARPGWSAWTRQRVAYGSSAAPLAARHPGKLSPVRTSPWSAVTWTLAAVGRPLLGAAVGVASSAALVRKLPDVPGAEAFRLALVGNLRAGDQLAAAVRRVWWPLAAAAAWRSPTARRVLLAAAVTARHPLRLADDLAYSLGVWRGMVTERTVQPALPRLTSFPGPASRPDGGWRRVVRARGYRRPT